MNLGPPPKFEHLKDPSLRDSLHRLRTACAPILANNLLPHFTDHSVEHSDNVASLIDEFVRPIQEGAEHLTDREFMVLYCSAYLHDIGMQFEKAGDTVAIQRLRLDLPWSELQEETRRDLLRRHHHEISAQIINTSATEGERPLVGIHLTAEYDPDYVAALCEAHVLDVANERYKELTNEGPGLRMPMLSGILRIADILDESRRRACRHRAETLCLDSTEQMHWWRHYYVEDVRFDSNERRITLRFDFPADRREEF